MLVKTGKWLLLLFPFLGLAFAAERIFQRSTGGAQVFMQPCLRWDDPALHHYYSPNCHSEMTVNGHPVSYSFNEDGLRDRPRAFFAGGSVEVYGDSVVKGIYINDDETIPRELERRLFKLLGVPFLNAGLRFSGPTLQSLLLRKNLEHYPPKAVVVFLDGHEPIFERYFRSQATAFDDQGAPTRFRLESDTDGSLSSSVFSVVARRGAREREWAEEIRKVPPTQEVLCAGIRRFARIAKENRIPLVFVALAHWWEALQKSAMVPELFERKEYRVMRECAAATGYPLIELNGRQGEMKREFFVLDMIHFSPEGVHWLADQLEGPLYRALAPQLTGKRH